MVGGVPSCPSALASGSHGQRPPCRVFGLAGAGVVRLCSVEGRTSARLLANWFVGSTGQSSRFPHKLDEKGPYWFARV